MTLTQLQPSPSAKSSSRIKLIYDLLLVIVLLGAAYLRISGLFWGEYQYLHPDERFLVWVGADISPVHSLGEYFNSDISSLNPQNHGHGFYVYGTLPMFVTRYAVEAIYGHSGFDEMTQVGRALSALADLLVVFLVFLVAERLYDRRVAILAAAFSGVAVLQIQQSHFFTMDTFINLFTLLAFYFAILASRAGPPRSLEDEDVETPAPTRVTIRMWLGDFSRHPLFIPCLGFGVALGMAAASKLNAVPMAMMMPLALIVWLSRLNRDERERQIPLAFGYLVMAAFVSLLVFRLGQPYAFAGPGFFGLKLNPKWIANLKELAAESSPDADMPFALQWARRSVFFSGKNLILWGLGLPLGVLAWSGFLWVSYRLLRSEWRQHLLIWVWTGFYFAWQSLQHNPTMRYQLPIYPMLAIFAAWGVIHLYDLGRRPPETNGDESTSPPARHGWLRMVAILLGAGVLIATTAYAFGFSRIYTRPITRVEASRWIYQNIPGPINLPIQSPDGLVNQPVAFPYDFRILPGQPFATEIKASTNGTISEITLGRVLQDSQAPQSRTLTLTLANQPNYQPILAQSSLTANFYQPVTPGVNGYTFKLDHPITVIRDQSLFIKIGVEGEQEQAQVPFIATLTMRYTADPATPEGQPQDQTLARETVNLVPGTTADSTFVAAFDGYLTHVLLASLTPQAQASMPPTMTVSLTTGGEELVNTVGLLTPQIEANSNNYLLTLKQPVLMAKGTTYTLLLKRGGGNSLWLNGAGLANEGEWDDGLPVRLDGYDGFGGIYPTDLNFNMYWDDNPDKLARFSRILDQTDYIVISSSRQWGSLTRIPERYPMITVYYRNLIGCPAEQDIYTCYAVAKPGMFQGNLGFDLVKVFQSDPAIGPLDINDQFAEEAFHVYDHPKVLIFKKNSTFNGAHDQAILGAVDFTQVVRLLPMRTGPQPATLMLPEDRLNEQRAGGTWSQLFNFDALYNRYQFLAVILWYLTILLLGLITYPIVRLALPGLADHGYPLARTAGMLILAYLVWLAGSMRIPFTRLTISAVLLLITLVSALFAWRQWDEIKAQWQGNRRYYLLVEALALGFFLLDLYIRYNNPDLWHPWKGGEKPMDFSYFNAVLKSTSFPPYDPWFAGGYLNYYYFGFVFVGVLVKWLGIVPAIAYNLIIPTIFSLMALGAFSIAWNLTVHRQTGKQIAPTNEAETEDEAEIPPSQVNPFWVGLSAALGMALLGNLGTVRMIYQGYQRLVAPGGNIDDANLIVHGIWALRGFLLALTGTPLPYAIGDWYWNPSRVIPAPGDVEPITEFPFFTVLYGDPHAHLFALPITLLALSFILALVLSRGRWRGWLGIGASFTLGAMAIGALRPTNTWDFYPYLALAVVGLTYSIWSYFDPTTSQLRHIPTLAVLPRMVQKFLVWLVAVLLLVGLSLLMYQPFVDWYVLSYSKVDLWTGSHTPISSYLTHWGLFLFIIVSWMVWETRDWMASTPAVELRRLKPYKNEIWIAVALLLMMVFGLTWLKVRVAWFVLPIAAWAGILLLRPRQSDSKRFVLFLVGTGLVLTLMVEVIVLVGDIGRMNTVFKFYLQVWTLFAVSAAAALGWLLLALPAWLPRWRQSWALILTCLVFGAALFPLMGGMAKMQDRISPLAPHTLDGMAYMQTAHYSDDWGDMSLSQDYGAIRWLQQNVTGSPVIVEANLRNLYRWGSRMTVYTGLPGVVGWEWHQQQQRSSLPGSWVSNRIAEIATFYTTTDLAQARAFLRKYDVRYIILGQQERGMYAGPGLEKFAAANGILWRQVYHEKDTTIYAVVTP